MDNNLKKKTRKVIYTLKKSFCKEFKFYFCIGEC